MRREYPQGAAMRRQTLKIVEAQSMTRKYLLDGQHRKVRIVFVIDRIEFDLLDQFQ